MPNPITLNLDIPKQYWNSIFATIYAKNNNLVLQDVKNRLRNKLEQVNYGYSNNLPTPGVYFGSTSQHPDSPLIIFNTNHLQNPLIAIHEQSHFLTDRGLENNFPLPEEDKRVLEQAYNKTGVKSFYDSLEELSQDLTDEYRAINNELRYILVDQYLDKKDHGYKKSFSEYVESLSPNKLNKFSKYTGYYDKMSLRDRRRS